MQVKWASKQQQMLAHLTKLLFEYDMGTNLFFILARIEGSLHVILG